MAAEEGPVEVAMVLDSSAAVETLEHLPRCSSRASMTSCAPLSYVYCCLLLIVLGDE